MPFILVMINYAMVCTMFPSVIVLHHVWFEMPFMEANGQTTSVWRIASIWCLKHIGQEWLLQPQQSGSSNGSEKSLRAIERWFQDTFAPFVWATKTWVVLGFAMLTLIMFFGYAIHMDKVSEPMLY